MEQRQLIDLLNDMSLEEKAGQLFQVTGDWFDGMEALEQTGPEAEETARIRKSYSHLAGSVLGVYGAANIKRIQSAYMERQPHHIPLLFMLDIINGYKTIYPIPLAQGAMFDPEFAGDCAAMAAKEGAAGGLHVTFSPMVDLVRDARWGRVMESTGEDVYLNSLYAKAMVEGYQRQRGGTDFLAACVKHFAGYGAPEGGREYQTMELSEETFHEFYLPAYESAVKAGSRMAMTAFQTVNWIPATVNRALLREILRGEMGFDGVLISDYAAIGETVVHGVSKDGADAARRALEAGVDIDMMSGVYPEYLVGLVKDGILEEALLDESVLRVLELKNWLGLFEDPFHGADEAREARTFLCEEHRKLEYEAAVKSFVPQILDLMKKLQKEDGSSILLITHDLGVVAEMCTRVIVMYAGKIVEMAPVEKLFATPSHPYTQGLIASVPKLGSGVKVLPSIPGSVPDLASMPTGCRFAPRCKYATDKCRAQEPELLDISEDQKCRCWRTQEG